MFRYLALGVVGLVALASLRAPDRTTVAPTKSATTSATADSAAVPIAYRPGEPSLVLDATRLPRGADGHFTAPVDVGGQSIEMLVDTGASAVALTIADARRLGIAVDPAGFTVVGSGASGPVRGQATTLPDVAVGGRHVAQVEAVVLEGLDRSLLGQSYLRRLERVTIDGDVMTLG